MTWINFISYLGMGYAAYYLVIFLLDSTPGQIKSNKLRYLRFQKPSNRKQSHWKMLNLLAVSSPRLLLRQD